MKQRKPQESVRGAYSALPHAVLDSIAYVGASPVAKALLNELIRQHNGGNNGRLHLAHTWLAPRGWPSKSVVEKARVELIKRDLIIQTRQGGLFIGPSWHALTWLPISNHVGLETSPSTYHPGAWALCNLPPTSRRKPPMKKNSQPVQRDSPAPYSGTASEPLDPYTGAIEAISPPLPDPYSGDDVLKPLPPTESLCAVERFHARIGGWLGMPARDRNPLGRTRNVRLFTTAFGHLIRNHGNPAERFPYVRALLTNISGSASTSVDRQFLHVCKFLSIGLTESHYEPAVRPSGSSISNRGQRRNT